MIQLVTQFDRPGILPGAAPQSCGACCCCCCCCCVVSTLAASVVTARSVGRPFVRPDPGRYRLAEPPRPAAAADVPGPDRGEQATTNHKIFAALLMPASVALGVLAVYWTELPFAGLLAPGAWLLGLVWLSGRGLARGTAAAVFVLGLVGFVAEALIIYSIIVS